MRERERGHEEKKVGERKNEKGERGGGTTVQLLLILIPVYYWQNVLPMNPFKDKLGACHEQCSILGIIPCNIGLANHLSSNYIKLSYRMDIINTQILVYFSILLAHSEASKYRS